MSKKDAAAQLIETAASLTGWSAEEAQNFLCCIRAETPEGLMKDVDTALMLARKTEMLAAIIDVMKQMGRFLEVRVSDDGELSIRFRPEIGVSKVEGGYLLNTGAGDIVSIVEHP